MQNTSKLGLRKPSLTDVINIDDFNYNSDKIDEAFGNISTTAQGTSFDNKDNGMIATNVQAAIEENKSSILSHTTQINSLQSTVGNSVSTLRTEQDKFVDLIY